MVFTNVTPNLNHGAAPLQSDDIIVFQFFFLHLEMLHTSWVKFMTGATTIMLRFQTVSPASPRCAAILIKRNLAAGSAS